MDLRTATKIALCSMMSTARANLSVGPPYDVGIYLNDSLEVDELRIQSDSPLLERLRAMWEAHLLAGIRELPHVSTGELRSVPEPEPEPPAPARR